MKKMLPLILLLSVLGMTAGCKSEKKTKDIITRKPVVVKPTKTQKMGDYDQSRQVEWLGNVYTVHVSFKADPSLPVVEDGNQKYYDNRITLRILRKDGTEFFSRTFTKADFRAYTDNVYGREGALLGIVFDRIENDQLYFAASVGSPDKSSDEFIPLVMKISRFGDVSISKDTRLDTDANEGGASSEVEQAEEDGV